MGQDGHMKDVVYENFLYVLFYVSHFCSYYSCHVTEAEGEVGIP